MLVVKRVAEECAVSVTHVQTLCHVLQERGGKGPVVSAVAAGGNSSAFLTRAPDEFPDGPGPQLWQR